MLPYNLHIISSKRGNKSMLIPSSLLPSFRDTDGSVFVASTGDKCAFESKTDCIS
ncbi:MAG: hypothetical protein AAF502_19685 [Bacteroidota bacterium]